MANTRNLINITDLTVEEIDKLIATADDIVANHADYEDICAHKKLATLFFEPSTRTRLSFEAAMLELGGSVLGFSSANSSSAAKGESVSDTIMTVGNYVDIIAMRHPKEGAPIVAAKRAEVPIINAGDIFMEISQNFLRLQCVDMDLEVTSVLNENERIAKARHIDTDCIRIETCELVLFDLQYELGAVAKLLII